MRLDGRMLQAEYEVYISGTTGAQKHGSKDAGNYLAHFIPLFLFPHFQQVLAHV